MASGGRACAQWTVESGDGTIDYTQTDPTLRAVISGTRMIEERTFKAYNRYLPIPQGNLSDNPQLTQNPGYAQ
jgi:hypothetical protein